MTSQNCEIAVLS